MKGQRVVVLGGAGFVGSHLCERLLDDGAAGVVSVDNYITGDERNVEHLRGRAGFEVVRQDITEGLSVDGPVHYVFNMASPASPIDYAKLPLETMRVGSLGTEHGLKLAQAKGAVFLQASTSEVYGDPHVHPQREDYWGNVNPIGPRACYDEAKRYAEALTMAYRRTHDVDTAIVRIFNTHGPRMRPNDGRAIPAFASQALTGRPITVAGDGSQTRSIIYVDDLVTGILKLLRSDLAG
ncbi:MAG TPA: NAD-dependent epimerase/dehydratase family protein, partial [Archangium sp.]|nr:NAD-dependent epimerase/dehydratase family protein [Archangium sp.]